MKFLKEIILKPYFFIPYFGFLFLGLGLIFALDKEILHLYINIYHAPFLDKFFKYFTWVGEAKVIVPISILVLIYWGTRKFFQLLVTYAFSGIVVQSLKRFVFENMDRPSVVMQKYNIYFVEGVELSSKYSFPSGHTTVAFAIFTFLVFNVNKRWLQSVYITIAILVAFSRVYLSQHFFQDILAGSIVGVLSAFIVNILFYKKQ